MKYSYSTIDSCEKKYQALPTCTTSIFVFLSEGALGTRLNKTASFTFRLTVFVVAYHGSITEQRASIIFSTKCLPQITVVALLLSFC